MPELKNLLLIICKTSGSQADVQPKLEAMLKKTRLSYTFKKVQTPPEIAAVIKKQAPRYQTVAVYGGDGSAIAAIKALIDTKVKLLILPGGTANTIPGQLGLPASALEVLALYLENRYIINYYDIASVNSQPFVLDMHSGWWTEAIKATPRELKKYLGAIGYGISAIRRLPKAEKQLYELELDNKPIKTQSYTTLIANQGFQNFLGLPLFARPHRSGMVQVAIIKSLSLPRLLLWVIGRSVSKRNLGGAVKTYRAHEVVLHQAPTEFVYDDADVSLKLPLRIIGGQHETKLIVPPGAIQPRRLGHIKLFITLNFIRFRERFQSLVSGRPAFDYTQLAPYLYVGGTYRRPAYRQFAKWGVTGIVNMRRSTPKAAPKGFEVLHLKTPDWTPPSLEALARGVEFIHAKVSKGEGVYVHCRQGEGRGPTMAAAYLISQGLNVEEAIAYIKKSRPMAHPNRSQMKRLAEWQQQYSKK